MFTAHGNSAQVNFLRAPEIVLRSLPGVSAEAADRIVAGRKEEPPISAADLAAMVGEGLLTAQGLALLSGGSVVERLHDHRHGEGGERRDPRRAVPGGSFGFRGKRG